ncbi:alpha/beta fold hydrolase [Pontibacter cellulosilyticus]|uniref:Alpha/beta hydrolase n=1 Tax=Pontibacter cellulosilyticus TaxID=1720253 RepID=A0A923N5W2_9BACT|nr:alpha/beta hydrolase [Pontibacter cellulosilyticus]MBC5993480.1 alpha/beta hydrolase [Pontibacter cellulosilyticus]
MSKVYFISGLGADWRMFQFLKLPDHIAQYQVKWLEPLSFDEPLDSYVKRLLPQIEDPNPILVGFSFGGLVAIELAKIIKPIRIIVISSLATRYALPWYYKLAGKALLHKYVPFKVMQNTYPIAPFFFGAQTPYERRLLKSVFFRIDEKFLRWALARLLDWKQEAMSPGLIQIHGTADKVLPFVDEAHTIKINDGEHLMVIHRAEEVSAVLSRILLDCTHDGQE